MLDTKLKNSKRISFIAAIVIIAAFAAGFMALYPAFEREAKIHRQEPKLQQNDEFLERLYQSNYVLYRDIKEKAEESNLSYAELYVKEKAPGTRGETFVSGEQAWDGDYYSLRETVREEAESFFTGWENEVLGSIVQEVDYCAIDEATGKTVKNTGRKIELLGDTAGTSTEEREALPYVFYVKVAYDGSGNIKNVSVKGKDSDELLKSVQRVMKSRIAENELAYASNWYEDETGERIHFQVGAPEAVTFIYALTEEQEASLSYTKWENDWWNSIGVYWQAGVAEIYLLMLLALAVIAFILFFVKGYCLHKERRIKPYLELILLGGIFLIGLNGLIVEMVYHTNAGNFNAEYARYLTFLPASVYPALTGSINFLVLFFAFGAWFYCVNALGEAAVLGVGGLIRERSLCVRLWRRFFNFCKKNILRFKEEMLHVDLSEDIVKDIRKAVFANFLLLAAICVFWFFGWAALVVYSVMLYIVIKKYTDKIQKQYKKLLEVTGSIAEGNLNTSFDEDLGVFESYKEQLYKIQEGFRKAVKEEVKSQRMKSELITNVSHDLKTPLTAITTYIELLKEEGITDEQREEYIAVLEKKSLRLKFLIEDLFEVSKANSENVAIQLVDVDICHLMRQVYHECEDKIEEANLVFRFRLPEEKVVLKLDSQKTYRIFENLYNNIIKYAMPHTRVYVDAVKVPDGIHIEMKNMSAHELNIDPHELTERFVRGDSARNTEGSGLGLAIAQSFTQLQGGTMEVSIDGDLFKVTLDWGKKE